MQNQPLPSSRREPAPYGLHESIEKPPPTFIQSKCTTRVAYESMLRSSGHPVPAKVRPAPRPPPRVEPPFAVFTDAELAALTNERPSTAPPSRSVTREAAAAAAAASAVAAARPAGAPRMQAVEMADPICTNFSWLTAGGGRRERRGGGKARPPSAGLISQIQLG